jgi:hypothetical protein
MELQSHIQWIFITLASAQFGKVCDIFAVGKSILDDANSAKEIIMVDHEYQNTYSNANHQLFTLGRFTIDQVLPEGRFFQEQRRLSHFQT